MTGETSSDRALDLDATLAVERAPSWIDAETLTRDLGAAASRWKLVVREGPDAGREFELPAGPASLGRGEGCTIRLGDDAVSRVHLRLEAGPEEIRFFDEGTKNGTRVDGVRRSRGGVGEGARIAVGRTVLEVRRGGLERGGGVVQQALDMMRGGRIPSLPSRVRARKLALVLALVMAAVLAAAIAGRLLVPSARPANDEAAERPREARQLFDQGLEAWRTGDREEAGRLLRLAAELDPRSEEPWRYLRRLKEAHPGRDAPSAEGEGEAVEARPVEAATADSNAQLPEKRFAAPSGAPRTGGEVAGGDGPASHAEARAKSAKTQRERRPAVHSRGEDAGRAEIEALLARAASGPAAARVALLREAQERLRAARISGGLEAEVRRRLADAAVEVAEEALAVGRLAAAATHLRLALEARPDLQPARARLEALRKRAESLFVEGYSLLEREPSRARERLELVVLLTEADDPLHARAKRWLERAGRP